MSQAINLPAASGASSATSDRVELLAFRIGQEEFCLPVLQVREIRSWTKPTPLPHAEPALVGVINLRGAVLPVIDLAIALALPDRIDPTRSVIIVVERRGQHAGLIAQDVKDILLVDQADIGPPPAISPDRPGSRLCGLALQGERFLRILDLAAVLPDTRAAR